MVTVDLERNPKQYQFFADVMTEVARHETWLKRKEQGIEEQLESPVRYWFYGGAIRGGKTFVCLALFVTLCKKYAGSRWHVIRRTNTDLIGTTVPSLEKIVKYSRVRWKRSQGDYYCEFENGSRIYFMSENYNQDKDHNRFKGLETNGILLEQLEELQESGYKICLSRIGSWYDVDVMPPAMLFATFNPTYNWVKTSLHDEWMQNGVEAPFHYQQALPDDNAFVTADQWLAWEQLDDETYQRYIKGNWTMSIDGQFMHQFNDTLHLARDLQYTAGFPLYFSFDFNVDPMTCTVWQTDGRRWARCIKEYRIPNSDTYEMCDAILGDWPDLARMDVRITGDASGRNRQSAALHHINHYDIIFEKLPLSWAQFEVPKTNPGISESRMHCNSILKSMPSFQIDTSCKALIQDMRFVLTGIDGKGNLAIQKTGMNKYANIDNAQLGHLLDTMRYFMHTALYDFVHIPKS